jgi:formylglycine-generating enzyme required for sulfatase activity
LSNTTYSGSNRIDEVAIYENHRYSYSPSPVKSKKANAWGFYDMTGNVWEWSMDQWNLKNSGYAHQLDQLSNHHTHQSYLVCGGAYLNISDDCHIDRHYVHQANGIYSYQGFRLAKSQINAETLPKSKKQISMIKRETQNLKGIDFDMIYCPKGELLLKIDKDQVSKKIEQDFWVAETQITQALWTAVMGWNDSYFHASFKDNPSLPVENITWYDCLFFCNQLSKLHAFTSCYLLSNIEKNDDHIIKADVTYIEQANGYRLPSSTEWEYVAKAGQNFRYSGSNCADNVAWFSHNSGILKLDLKLRDQDDAYKNICCTHTVKTKKPNQWGIYDMSGNVDEWCFDTSDQQNHHRITKGGNCFDLEKNLEIAHHQSFSPDEQKNSIGLRIFRSNNL